MRKPKITFLCPTMTQPRFIKRVEAAIAQGFSVQVLGFERGYYSNNKFPSEAKVVCLGKLRDGNYVKRAFSIPYFRGLVSRKLEQFRPDIGYSFGTDNLFLFWTLRKKIRLLVHEVGDLRVTDKLAFLKRKVLGNIEKNLLASANRIVVTSDAFADHFEKSYGIPCEKFTVLENKLSNKLMDLGERQPSISLTGPIRIGVIGLLRYKTLFDLIEVVKETPAKCRLDIWGDGPLKERLLESAEGFDNIRYHGSYVYPDALPQIYSETDVSFVVYDNTDINVRLALPNKLYESAYFGIPMIVATETQLWTQAKEKGIGFAVRPGDVDELRNTFAKLDKQVLRDMQKKALSRINSSQLVEDGNKLFLKLKNECRELTKKIDCQD